MTIKPIQTYYSGCVFRSRVEARWAVFMNSLGVKWQYEKEGFDLGGLYYLPDFWLPEHGTWLEIKGADPEGEELEKFIRFHNSVSYLPDNKSQRVYMLIGQPWIGRISEQSYELAWPAHDHISLSKRPGGWYDCPFCGTIQVGSDFYKDDKEDGISCWTCDCGDGQYMEKRVESAYFHEGIVFGPCGSIDMSERLMKAYDAATSARFEHGETPDV